MTDDAQQAEDPTGEDVPRVHERRRHDRADVLSTSLLLELTTITVDPSYVEAAARRAAGEVPAGRSGRFVAAAALAVIGVLCAVAFTNTRAAAPQAARVRSGLLSRVNRLTQQADSQDTQLGRLRAQVALDRERALASAASDSGLAATLHALEFATGSAPVAGRGVTVRLADAPVGNSGSGSRVQDRDVQRAVNIAWSAGAEAVSVNGQRIGPRTAIRQAGDAILVDYRPVTSPYEIRAIGEPAALERAFTVADVSSALRAIVRSLDFELTVKRASELDLPGTGAGGTAVARSVGDPSAAATNGKTP